MHIGITELALIAVIAIVLIKPEKLSEYMKMFFQAKATIQNAKEEMNRQQEELKESVNSLENAAMANIAQEKTTNQQTQTEENKGGTNV